jgi:hypothetical protein
VVVPAGADTRAEVAAAISKLLGTGTRVPGVVLAEARRSG